MRGARPGKADRSPTVPTDRRPRQARLLTLALVLAVLVGLVPITPALATYTPVLTSPTPPAGASTFVWIVSGVQADRGQEIGYVELSGCWTAGQVASAT